MIHVENGEMRYEGEAIMIALEVTHLLSEFCKSEPELCTAVCTYLANDLDKALHTANPHAVEMATLIIKRAFKCD